MKGSGPRSMEEKISGKNNVRCLLALSNTLNAPHRLVYCDIETQLVVLCFMCGREVELFCRHDRIS